MRISDHQNTTNIGATWSLLRTTAVPMRDKILHSRPAQTLQEARLIIVPASAGCYNVCADVVAAALRGRSSSSVGKHKKRRTQHSYY